MKAIKKDTLIKYEVDGVMETKESLALSVGGLLYTPASNNGIVEHLVKRDWANVTSVSLCLEDSIMDSHLQEAEHQLHSTLSSLRKSGERLPLLFVRVRSPKHFLHVHELLQSDENVLTGYIFPKFDETNANEYLNTLYRINQEREKVLYAMPIIESRSVAKLSTRFSALSTIRKIIDEYKNEILNVRVGGNDFSNLFGLRREITETIYDIGPVRDILIDILNWFSDDYVVSGPVWEYYGKDSQDNWAKGLRKELSLDKANGFIGKTAIHPSQLPIIYESLKVSENDYSDAKGLLTWKDEKLAVSGSNDNGRMNEVKCHTRWANRIIARAKIYGIREESSHEDLV